MLKVTNLVKSFGSLRAVDGVSLRVKPNTITGLIGSNGAGKTTLFRLICGEIFAESGQITFGKAIINGETPDQIFKRGLARTFQIPRPFPEMTVLENLMLAPIDQTGERFWNNWIRYGQVRREERRTRERALEILSFTGLVSLANAPAGQLSGGQQKLLELARVLMIDPQLILLDEPAAGVNQVLLDTLVEKIFDLHKRGITFLIIEHNMELVMNVCQPIIVMAQGRVIFEGDAAGVRSDSRVLDAYLGEIPA
jgi:ABC-type branched-subunit amino acid transport system ATPase component